MGWRRVLGWGLVPTLAVGASAGTLVLIRAAIGDGTGTLADSMSQAQVRAAYAGAVKATPLPRTPAPAPPSGPTASVSPSATESGTHGPSTPVPTGHPTAVPRASGPASHPSAHSPSPSSSRSTSPPPATVTRVLTSSGGSVVVRCTGATVYLVSWSPAQGYRVNDVHRGPGEEAEIDFESDRSSVSVGYHCTSSGPVQQVEGGDSSGYDGGGSGHDG
jgi:hypothetical protein